MNLRYIRLSILLGLIVIFFLTSCSNFLFQLIDQPEIMFLIGFLALVSVLFYLLWFRSKAVTLLVYYSKNLTWFLKVRKFFNFFLILLVCLSFYYWIDQKKYFLLDFGGFFSDVSHHEKSDSKILLSQLLKKELERLTAPIEFELVINQLKTFSPIASRIDYELKSLSRKGVGYRKVILHEPWFVPDLSKKLPEKDYLRITYLKKSIKLFLPIMERTVATPEQKSMLEGREFVYRLENMNGSMIEAIRSLTNSVTLPRVGLITSLGRTTSLKKKNNFEPLRSALQLAGIKLNLYVTTKMRTKELIALQQTLEEASLIVLDSRAKLPFRIERKIIVKLTQKPQPFNLLLLVDPVVEKGPMSPIANYLLDRWGFSIMDDKRLIVEPLRYRSFSSIDDLSMITHPFIPEVNITDFKMMMKGINLSRVELEREALTQELEGLHRLVSPFPPTLKGVRSFSPVDQDRFYISLLSSSPHSWVENNLVEELNQSRLDRNQEDFKGPHLLGWLSLTPVNSKIAVLGDSDFLEDPLFLSGLNQGFSVNLIRWLMAPVNRSSSSEFLSDDSNLLYDRFVKNPVQEDKDYFLLINWIYFGLMFLIMLGYLFFLMRSHRFELNR